MKSDKKIILIIFTLLLVLLAACNNSTDERTAKSDDQSKDYNSSQEKNDDSSDLDSTEIDSNYDSSQTVKDLNEKKVTSTSADVATDDSNNSQSSNAIKEENISNTVSLKEENLPSDDSNAVLKQEHLKKLNNTKKEAEALEPVDSSTFALKKVEDDRWNMWDDSLNEIYGVLEQQLPPHQMEELREEQRNWLKLRDDNALEASYRFKGGTQEHVEYVSVLANLTEERCFELVNNYMK
ncbi:DUF1311 domain-containing protein [Oceanobacillus piezotolerans]|uniref:DUF1311 domain-containing protein n=1 Tax=Oceanobacillus piezotolerans TaxID=2448030 RepID=A0A498DE39_9BACI|nr:lysozyme inhibitor LprI family protein [Oceanobacillus piezotolerans]RLL48346.1 DUF1311 domain-containing protein [Oceanobacillus piezotolerans]